MAQEDVQRRQDTAMSCFFSTDEPKSSRDNHKSGQYTTNPPAADYL